jgi:hypothetical protein
LIYRALHNTVLLAVALGVSLPAISVRGQSPNDKPRLSLDREEGPRRRTARPTATIHWQGVTFGDAISRLRPLFDEVVFVDRRIDPNRPVSLDTEATSAEQVVTSLATKYDLKVSRLGALVYVGPVASGDLRALVAARHRDIARIPAALRTTLVAKETLSWPRFTEPRSLLARVAATHGWRLADAERIPHDLWAAGELPELTVADSLTVLLYGFGLTFELRPTDRAIAIVELPSTAVLPAASPVRPTAEANPARSRTTRGTQQVYTLRVQEKPVGAVLRELGQRLKWSIQIDEDAIRAAGKSLDQRVSFSVENADREKLLDALLTPAGLEYTISGEQIRVLPRRY